MSNPGERLTSTADGDGRRRWLCHRRDLEVVTSNERSRRLHKTGEGGGKRLRPQYVTRASVALPFVMALGFALAAISALLVQRFGYVFSNWMVPAASP